MTRPAEDATAQDVLEADPLMHSVAVVMRLQAAKTMAAPVPAPILALLGALPETFPG
jgi:hypothetical protein